MLENNIKSLIKILEESNVDDLEISTFWGKQKIRIRKNSTSNSDKKIDSQDNTTLPLKNSLETMEVAETATEKVVPDINIEELNAIESRETVKIKAPLVGTYYAAPKPDAPPFISEGDVIHEGQIICVIEAMKIFNEIESEITGKVIKILITNGTPVEYGQDLIIVAPK